jgi:metallo-beta-lactamase class B
MRLNPASSLIIAALLLSCASDPLPIPQDAKPLQPDVYVQSIGPGIWRHVSYRRFPTLGSVPSNGLVVTSPKGVLLVDTAWDPEQTARILDWVEENLGNINVLVVTHAHDDRLGGLAEVHRRRIPSYALAETVELAAEHGEPPIEHAVASAFSLERFGVLGELFFPGPGHTVDNATVWLQEPQVLAGGCLVRASAATTMGNTSEADLDGWPRAIAALQERYPDARIVVPGHGEPGGPELLAHTRELLGK